MKKWTTPELIVLVRGKPEEAVLTVCKTDPSAPSSGADSAFNACEIVDCGGPCSSTARS